MAKSWRCGSNIILRRGHEIYVTCYQTNFRIFLSNPSIIFFELYVEPLVVVHITPIMKMDIIASGMLTEGVQRPHKLGKYQYYHLKVVPLLDWTLTVNIRNVNLGESSIGVSVKGTFGYSDHQDVPNRPSPSASFSIPGGAIPAGNRFDVCAGTGLGTLLPRCTHFTDAQDGDMAVTVSP